MYKPKNKSFLEQSKYIFHGIKRKFILIIVAIMIGVSNVIYEEDHMINGNQNYIEQEQEEDTSKLT